MMEQEDWIAIAMDKRINIHGDVDQLHQRPYDIFI
jgi:hypothetical protein